MPHWLAAPPHATVTLPRAVVAAVLAAGVLAGCASDPETRAQPLPALSTASHTPTASPTPPPPPSPTGPTAANAAAFVRAYYDAINRAAVTGKVGNLSQFSSSSCSVCTQNLSYSIQLEKRDRRLQYGQLRVLGITPQPVQGLLTTVTVTLSATQTNVLDAQGNIVSSVRSRPPFHESVALSWEGRTWFIQDILEF